MKSKKIKKDVLNFNAIFLEEDDGGYSVSVPVLPGCFSQGDSFEDAVKNIQEAIELYLDEENDMMVGEANERVKKEFLVPVQVYGH